MNKITPRIDCSKPSPNNDTEQMQPADLTAGNGLFNGDSAYKTYIQYLKSKSSYTMVAELSPVPLLPPVSSEKNVLTTLRLGSIGCTQMQLFQSSFQFQTLL